MTEPTSEMERAFAEVFADPADAAAAIIAERSQAVDNPVDDAPNERTYVEYADLEAVVLAYNEAFTKIDARLGKMRRPPRERRTGAAARVNPDDIRVFYAVLVGSLLLPLVTFAASFQFQRAFGEYTPLEEWWWWVIPCILELPLVVLTPVVLIFRRRHESTAGPWLTMIVLTMAAAAINFLHAAVDQGLETATDWAGALFVAAWPLLTLVTFKFFTRLAVKPEPKPTPEPAPPARKATTRKAPK